MSEPRYVIGLDLGTTNSSLAFVDTGTESGDGPVSTLEVPQVVAAGEVGARRLLPSAVYLPGEHELAPASLDLPWQEEPDLSVGLFARDQGAQVPQRLITSAKSWLCHGGVDRRSPVLPWASEAVDRKLSPVEASTAVLQHLRDAWDHVMASGDEGLALSEQDVTITVPASFDAAARDLTEEAARAAGFERLTLLEEPQAAIYAWIAAQGDDWRKLVSTGDVILVCDVGGGTSDFSLIAVEEEDGDLTLRRVAVGNHILLGGDNFDLALARTVEAAMKARFDAWQLSVAWHACRAAKEKLLADGSVDKLPIVVPGRGSGLVGGTLRGELTRKQVDKILLDGFFPKVAVTETPKTATGAGLQELGLPYAADPAVTRHLARFLSSHGGDEGFARPSAILFNGGVFAAPMLRDRIHDIVGGWVKKAGGGEVRVLPGVDLDLAVARGAARYGVVRRGKGIRIRGGTARSYYVGVEVPMPAVPGLTPPVRAVCVAPQGMEEGTEADLPDRRFGLAVGEPARFRFFSSSTRSDDEVGEVHEDPEGAGLDEIEPVETTLEVEDAQPGTVLPVTLRSVVTETGTLQLWAVAPDSGERFRLEFRIRGDQSAD